MHDPRPTVTELIVQRTTRIAPSGNGRQGRLPTAADFADGLMRDGAKITNYLMGDPTYVVLKDSDGREATLRLSIESTENAATVTGWILTTADAEKEGAFYNDPEGAALWGAVCQWLGQEEHAAATLSEETRAESFQVLKNEEVAYGQTYARAEMLDLLHEHGGFSREKLDAATDADLVQMFDTAWNGNTLREAIEEDVEHYSEVVGSVTALHPGEGDRVSLLHAAESALSNLEKFFETGAASLDYADAARDVLREALGR